MDVKHRIGAALAGIRPGLDKLVEGVPEIAALPCTLRLSSPAFGDGETMPARFSAGGNGISPPLAWDAPPADTHELLLVVEDADPPLPKPMVHAIVSGIAPEAGTIAEGTLSGAPSELRIGRNSYMHTAWLPLDPPAGHGVHRYVFQLYALSGPAHLTSASGRGAARTAITTLGLARGRLVGTFETR